jgi:hypothetical protein
MVGLDAAGKTTILYKLKLGEIVTTIPTIGELYSFSPGHVCRECVKLTNGGYFRGMISRIQRRDRRVQEHFFHRVGRWWSGQDQAFVATLYVTRRMKASFGRLLYAWNVG